MGSLAKANLQTVLKLWQGLGYYSRARNLHEAARYVVKNLDGKFPSSYDELLKLKGVGVYTAAAVSSIAFNEKRVVVDGNVERLLSRYFGIKKNIHTPAGMKKYYDRGIKLMAQHSPSEFNQALMEFGALQCVPLNPACDECPLRQGCYAYGKGKVNALPVRKEKVKIRNRYFDYFIIRSGNDVYLRKRTGNDIWKSLYDFPLVESGRHLPRALLARSVSARVLKGILPADITGGKRVYRHKLSHQTLNVRFWTVQNGDMRKQLKIPGIIKANLRSIKRFPFPKLIESYVNEEVI